MADITKDSMSTSEAAKVLGVSLRTVQIWVESGILRAWKTSGGHRRVLKSSIDTILAERSREAEGSLKSPAFDPAPAPFRLLIVEDEETLLKLYRLNFDAWDIPVELATAKNGFEALLYIGELKPDFIVLDLNMPGMDGFRMLRQLSYSRNLANTEIVVVTPLDRQEIEDRGGLPEAIAILPKPIPFSTLKKMVSAKYKSVMASRRL